MEIFSKQTNFAFLKYRTVAVVLSTLLNIGGLLLWFSMGDAKYGVEFRGGTEVLVNFTTPTTIDEVRGAFRDAELSEAIVQEFEKGSNKFSIRLKTKEAGEIQDSAKASALDATAIEKVLTALPNRSFEKLKQEFVGPTIGEQIRREGLIATLIALAAIFAYISIRFDWRFASGAVVALIHDVIVMVSAVLLFGGQITGATLAAALTIVGFSVNDTVVVYDRIRENLAKRKKPKQGETFAQYKEAVTSVMNDSLNQTLSRTIITSFTAFLSALSLFLFGGGEISELAFALCVGIVTGVYSTVYIACPVILACTRKET